MFLKWWIMSLKWESYSILFDVYAFDRIYYFWRFGMRGMLQLLDELLMQIDLKDKIHLAFKVIINDTLHES